MSSKSWSALILAAGKGTRMHSDLPKVLQPLSNKPIIHYVYETATSLKPNEIAQVYLDLHNQKKSVWTHEIDLRPYMEKF